MKEATTSRAWDQASTGLFVSCVVMHIRNRISSQHLNTIALHVCRFETDGPMGANGEPKKVYQDTRSLVLSECQYQFGLGRAAKNAEAETADESGMPFVAYIVPEIREVVCINPIRITSSDTILFQQSLFIIRVARIKASLSYIVMDFLFPGTMQAARVLEMECISAAAVHLLSTNMHLLNDISITYSKSILPSDPCRGYSAPCTNPMGTWAYLLFIVVDATENASRRVLWVLTGAVVCRDDRSGEEGSQSEARRGEPQGEAEGDGQHAVCGAFVQGRHDHREDRACLHPGAPEGS